MRPAVLPLEVVTLAALPGVSGVNIKGAAMEWTTAEILCSTNADIGEDIFKSVVAKGWTLSELKHETASLEDVFTQLTRG